MAIFTVLNSLLGAALLPLVASLLLLAYGRRFGREGRAAGGVSLGFAIASFALALTALVQWVGLGPQSVEAFTYPWIMLPPPPATPFRPVAAQAITVGCLVDSLTVLLFVVLTLLSVFVQLFALGSVNKGRPRFYALFQLLQFAILALLLSNSLIQFFVCWSLLSLAGYLLMRHAMADSAQRPALPIFLLHLLGDAALLLGIGIFLLHTHSFNGLAFFDSHGTSVLADAATQTLQIQPHEYIPSPRTAAVNQGFGGLDPKSILITGMPEYVSASAGFLDIHWLTWMGICFLVASLTRMAQFPVQWWAARAAEAPAPVTATVLGSVSITAGIFLLARVMPLLTLDVRLIGAITGSVTLACACLMALVQTDIRKVLAWLAVAQGGYVLLFLGTGGYTAGIVHLITQAFMKAALFLAAGAVLHGIGTADLRQLGGLWRRFPITAAASLICVLAVAGAPWLSGSYSINLGLSAATTYADALHATSGNNLYLWLLSRIPAAAMYIMAFAIGRWWWLIFAGPNRNPKLLDAARESAFLTLPIIILAGLSVGYWYEFSQLKALIAKSIPAVLLPAEGPPLVIRWMDADPAYAAVFRVTGWAFLGMAAAVAIYFNGFGLATRLRRLPGVNLVDYWLRQGMFFEELFAVLLRVFVLLAWIVRLLDRWIVMLLRGTLLILSIPAALIGWIERPKRPLESVPSETAEHRPGT